ncbi:MAG: nitrogen regulation protein NR(II), partial [Nitrospiria bacterium]
RASQRAFDISDQERLRLLGETVGLALSMESDHVEKDIFYLHSFAIERGIHQMTLIDRQGNIMADSRREVKKGEKIPEGLKGDGWETVLSGKIVVAPSHGKRMGKKIQTVWVPMGEKGVVRLAVPVAMRDDPNIEGLLLFIKVFGIVGIGVIGYYFYRSVSLRSASPKGESDSDTTETGFVIDTFQGLIHKLKQKEESLERQKGIAEEYAETVESYNENILQSVTSGVLTFDREKKITTFNAAASAILNIPPERVRGKTCEELFGKDQKVLLLLEETLEKEKEVLREECEVGRPDGEKIWLGLNTSLLRDRHYKIIGATLVFTDLTEMKMLEEQIELKKRLAVMGEMSAWIAHEFRNYMGTILGFSRLLAKKLEPDDPRQGMIEAITDELTAMERLITELLSYGKRAEIHPAPIALIPLLKELMEQFIAMGTYSDIRWSTVFQKEVPKIGLDPVLIRQALSNLIRNGLEAMSGSGEMRLRVFERPSGIAQVEISDTGAGIPKENLDKIFLPFFTTKEKGTGLGLALVHKIILSHGGHLSVASVEGKGTTFRVSLPLNIQPVDILDI